LEVGLGQAVGENLGSQGAIVWEGEGDVIGITKVAGSPHFSPTGGRGEENGTVGEVVGTGRGEGEKIPLLSPVRRAPIPTPSVCSIYDDKIKFCGTIALRSRVAEETRPY
jgi:hypothetical protein